MSTNTQHEIGHCTVCRKSFTYEANRSAEHVLPSALGGSLITHNLCKLCNNSFGNGFEGRVINHFIMKSHIYFNEIKKNIDDNLIHPFYGTYPQSEGRKIRVEHDGQVDIVTRNIDIKTKNNKVTVQVKGKDDSDKEIANEIVKALIRNNVSLDNIRIDSTELTKRISELVKQNKNLIEVGNLEILKDISIDLTDWELLWTKIIYQLTVIEFGDKHLSDKTSLLLSNFLLDRKLSGGVDIDLFINDELIENLLDGPYHCVMFIDNICFLKIFNVTGSLIISSSRKVDIKSPIFYVFDYKNKTYERCDLLRYVTRYCTFFKRQRHPSQK